MLCLSVKVSAQSGISFTTSTLSGVNVSNPTTLAFGPDNRLYVTQQDGFIFAYTVQNNGPNNYAVTNTEVISVIRTIPNHNDRGEPFPFVQRQVTGIVATGTAANPVLYICSSDPRIGGGGELGDIDLDTNSGMISKLTKNGSNWSMTHLVRGLPRCEENHSPNGLWLDEVNNILYLAQAGNTNAGSPSNNFGFLTEYALSAAILEIDLGMIDSQFGGSYTLPTLDDPTRPNLPDGTDVNDPFGGNDGLNQAKLIIGGPIQIYATGMRLSYDLLITKTPGKSGRMYTIGNGGNAGWGGYPENEGQPNVTNNRLPSEPGSTGPTLTDGQVNNRDGLHYITGPGYYGGHPNPIRANPAGAGLYWFDNQTGIEHFELNPTVDWPPYPISMANPIEADYRNPGVNDGSLYTWGHSTNGIAEYTSTAFFNGAMAGNLLAASWDGGIHRVELTEDGTAVTQVTKIFTGFGDTPLDVIAQGDGQIFAGTIWAVVYGGNGVTIFEPVGNPFTCTGDNDNYTLDDDDDGYSNGDETDNGTDPCSASSKPNDFDLDFISDLADSDDDNDGANDIVDKFALDTNNGMGTQIPLDYPFLNGDPGFGLFGIGQTGLMTNYVEDYSTHYDLDDPALIAGGAVGVLSVPAQPGDAVTNNQQYAFQFGIPISQSVATFTLNSRILGAPFFNGATGSELGTQSVGIYFGNGDQDNYFKFVLHANNGNPGFQILCEQNGSIVSQQMIPIPNILSTSQADLFIEVNAQTGLVTCRYQNTSLPNPVDVGQSFTLSGNLLSLLVNDTDAVAVGVIASCGNKVPFSASWDYMKVTTTTNQVLTNIIRINSGGPAQNFGGEAWVADQNFTGGTVYSTAAAISNTTQDQIYQTERFGNFSYAIPVPGAGTYAVDLHLAEIYFTTAGSRIFNINIENGQFVRNNLDLIQTYGSINQANVLRADNLSISDGTINITFTTVVDNAKISGISVSRYNTPPANTPPVVAQPYPDQSIPSTQTSLVIQLGQIFNDNGGVNNLTFSVPNNTNAALISNTQIVGTQLTFTLSGTTGSGMITLRATDASNASVDDVFQLTVTQGGGTPQLVNVIRINSGGPAQNFGGEAWVADQNFTGGTVYSTAAAISNTTQDQIYQTERFGNFSYAIPAPVPGTYAVDLHLAEIYFTTAGSRIFNINIENGQFVRNNLDLIQTYGSINQANVLRADNLNITDGTINITFTTVVDNAKISGLSVGRYDTPPANTPPVVVQPYPDQSIPLTQTSLVIQLGQIFNDNGGVNNLTFSVPNNTNAALISNTQIVGTQLTFTLSGTTGSGMITLRATDASNASVDDVFQLTVTQGGGTPQLVNVIRINSGGPAQNFGGEAWVADQNFTGGNVYSTGAAISNTTQDQIYQTERWGNFSYAIPVPGAGTYAVDLHLAEIYFTTAGSRIFNINIENGQFVRNNLDLIQTYGANNQAIVLRADNLNIVDGTINITFTSIVNNAKISGLSVGRYDTPPANTPPVVVQPYPDQSIPSTQTSLVIQLGQIFNDNGGVNNLTFSVPNNTNAALISNTQIVGTQLTFTLSGTTGSGMITLRATDASNASVDDVFQLTVTQGGGTPQLVNVIRINSGGPTQNFGGEAWVADQNFTGGNVYSTGAAISNTTQDQIYQTERWGNFSYAIPVPGAGTYAVDLHLAEIYFTTAGSRIFNINIENGQFVRSNLDLIQTYGANNQAIVLRADNLNIVDGTINITFTSIVNNAKISGIAVGQYSTESLARSAVLNHAPVVKTPKNVTIYEGHSWNYQVEASDADGDNLSYATKNLPASLYIDKATGYIKGTIEVNANTYPVIIKVTDSNGLSTEVNFVVTIAAKPILREVEEQKFIVYPNPTDKNEFSVRIDVKRRDKWNFTLLDFTGKQFELGSFELAEGMQELTLDLTPHNLSSGLYYLTVENREDKKVIKVGVKL